MVRRNHHRYERQQSISRSAWVVAVMVLLLAACGSDDAEVDTAIAEAVAEADAAASEPASVDEPEAPQPTAEPAPSPAATAGPAPRPTDEPTVEPEPTPIPDDGTPALESVYEDEPIDGGWAVAAGAWASSSFSTPIRFELPTDATLLTDGLGRLEFRFGPSDAPTGWLFIVEPTAVNRPTGPIPIDLVDADNAFADADVTNQSTSAGALGEVTIYDFSTAMQPIFEPFLAGCFRRPGLWCIEPFRTDSGEGQVSIAMDRLHRLGAVDFGEEGRLYVLASPASDDDVAVLDAASSVVESLALSGVEHDGVRSIDTLGLDAESVPAGSWVRTIGSTLVSVDLAEDLAVEPMIFPEVDAMGWRSGGASMFMVHVDLSADLETGMRPADGGPWSPASWDDVRAQRESLGATVEWEATTFAGLPAVEYTLDVDGGELCPRLAIALPPDTRCTVFMRSVRSPFYFFEAPTITQRLIYIEELGLSVSTSYETDEPEGIEVLAELEAALQLSSLDGGGGS